jgi:hypothetical protein
MCKRDTGEGLHGEREKKWRVYWVGKMIKVSYLYVYGDSIKKHFFKGRAEGGGLREYNRRGELAQNTVCIYGIFT